MSEAGVSVTVRYGTFGDQAKTVVLPLSKSLMRELTERIELSSDPFSLMIASPGMFGGKGNAVTIRRETFKMRLDVAEQIARAMVPALLEAFGVNDELDGYRLASMSPDEREYHERAGRLPRKCSEWEGQ